MHMSDTLPRTTRALDVAPHLVKDELRIFDLKGLSFCRRLDGGFQCGRLRCAGLVC